MNRRGSYIAEAALVLPVIVLVTITVILIVLFFYEESVMQSRLHMALRAEAGAVAERTVCGANCRETGGDSQASITVSGGLNKKVSGVQHLRMKNAGILTRRDTFQISGDAYVTDGVFARRWRP